MNSNKKVEKLLIYSFLLPPNMPTQADKPKDLLVASFVLDHLNQDKNLGRSHVNTKHFNTKKIKNMHMFI